jgi:hypothetical protein
MAEAGRSTQKRRHRVKSEPGSTRVAGGARLKKAAAQQLRKNGVQLAKALMDKALEGSVASARMVVELAEVKEEEKPKKRRPRGLTEAQRLAMEPQWEKTGPSKEPEWWEVGLRGAGTKGQGTAGEDADLERAEEPERKDTGGG